MYAMYCCNLQYKTSNDVLVYDYDYDYDYEITLF